MANIKRQKRVDLGKFDPTWSQSYILFHTQSFREVMNFKTDYDKKGKKNEANEREIKKIERKIEIETDDVVLEGLYKALDELKMQEEAYTQELINTSLKMLKNAFAGGMIYDIEEKKLVNLSKEDLDSFDSEIVNELTQHVTGTYTKNV